MFTCHHEHSPPCAVIITYMQAVSAIPSLFVYKIPPQDDRLNSSNAIKEYFGAFGTVMDGYLVTHAPGSPNAMSHDSADTSDSTGAGAEDGTSYLSAIVKFASWTDAEKAYTSFTCDSVRVKYARPRSSGDGIHAISPKRLFIGQVPTDLTEDDVKRYFDQFGTLQEVSLLKNKNDVSAGCAFIQFETWEACDRAIAASNSKVVFASASPKRNSGGKNNKSKALVVKYAKAKHPINNTSHVSEDAAMRMAQHQSWPHPMYGGMYPMPHATGYHVSPYNPYNQAMYQVGQYSYQMVEDADSRKLFVGQLPRHVHEDALAQLFGFFGTIESVTILRDSVSNESQGCGFVTFVSRYNAMMAAQTMNGQPCSQGGRPMVVQFAARRDATRSHPSNHVPKYNNDYNHASTTQQPTADGASGTSTVECLSSEDDDHHDVDQQ
jgi:RNA recognition motif-containing protein